MADMKEIFDQWLRDAHAMEEQVEQMLKAQAGRIQNYPKRLIPARQSDEGRPA